MHVFKINLYKLQTKKKFIYLFRSYIVLFLWNIFKFERKVFDDVRRRRCIINVIFRWNSHIWILHNKIFEYHISRILFLLLEFLFHEFFHIYFRWFFISIYCILLFFFINLLQYRSIEQKNCFNNSFFHFHQTLSKKTIFSLKSFHHKLSLIIDVESIFFVNKLTRLNHKRF